jgi:hypothetical protein
MIEKTVSVRSILEHWPTYRYRSRSVWNFRLNIRYAESIVGQRDVDRKIASFCVDFRMDCRQTGHKGNFGQPNLRIQPQILRRSAPLGRQC